MAVTNAQRKARQNYLAKLKAYTIRLQPEQAELLEQSAQTAEQSVNSYVIQAVMERIARESQSAQPEPEPAHSTADTEPARESQPAPTE